jgi:hypothetical protein
MTNRKHSALTGMAVLLLAGVSAVALPGCSEEEPQVAVAPPPPPPPPPAPPKATTIEALMAEHNIDPRVSLTEERAPDSTEERIAILKFFDAFARGNDKALAEVLAAPDRFALDELVKSGQFTDLAAKIKKIDIQTGDGMYDKVCALAVFDLTTLQKIDFQPQLWSYTQAGGQFVFEAESCPPNMIDRLSGSDWIKSWFEVLKREMEIAEQPDEVIVIQKRIVDTADDVPASTGGDPGSAPGPAPGGSPGRRRQTGEPQREPSLPG